MNNNSFVIECLCKGSNTFTRHFTCNLCAHLWLEGHPCLPLDCCPFLQNWHRNGPYRCHSHIRHCDGTFQISEQEMCTTAFAHNDTLESSWSSELAAICTLKQTTFAVRVEIDKCFTEMGRGSAYAVSLGPTYAVTAHYEKVSNLTSKNV